MLICIVLYSDRRDCALKYVCNGKTIAYQCVACVLVKLFALRCHFFCHFGNTYVSIFILCGVNKPNMSTAKHDCIFQHKLSIGNKSTAFSNVFFNLTTLSRLLICFSHSTYVPPISCQRNREILAESICLYISAPEMALLHHVV